MTAHYYPTAGEPTYGDTVEIFKGRKNPKGVTGTLFWMRKYQYGYYRSGVNPLREVVKVGIKKDDETVFWDYITNIRKVEAA